MTAPTLWPTRTTDGRDLSHAEFRTIPGFGRYEISRDGDVRNRATWRILRESVNQFGAFSYTLRKDDGGKTSRNYKTLVRYAWGQTEGDK
ncbi:hypothetical protein [Pseudarthrobacter sp. S6]|uniref:hypothetical protein n=1 Tax=Pseudarthrobacter sp. S6 TaxID=3418420 RepID=UPI003CF3D5BF